MMDKYTIFAFSLLLPFTNCFADTFVHRRTGESFNGYATQIKKHNRTQVRIEKKNEPQYLDLGDYEIRYNHLGRKNKVFTFSISGPIDLVCETEALEKAIVAAANQGPLFILTEIDTPGGRIDLAKRICAAITKIDNCPTVAFVKGDEYGGAISAGAAVALACDKIYMKNNTVIGAATLINDPKNSNGSNTIYGRVVSEKSSSAWRAYLASLAEQNGRPTLLARAMADKDIEVLEVTEDGRTFFVERQSKKPNQTLVKIWSKRGSLLTLTAAEAVYCKVTDKTIPLLNQLLLELDATKALMVPNKDCEKAKRNFEKVKKRFDDITADISSLEKRSDELLKGLNRLETQIRDKRININRYKYWRDKDALEKMLTEQEKLIKELLFLLKDLERKYEDAIRLAKKSPDLNAYAESLVKGMNFAAARYDEVNSRPDM